MAKQYLTKKDYLESFTISELNGAILRLGEIEQSVKDTNFLYNCMVIHQEMAKEGFLTPDIDVSASGMFRTDSIENLSERTIFLGMASSGDPLRSISMYDVVRLNLGQNHYVFVDQYKQVLLNGIADIRRTLSASLEEALKEHAEQKAEVETRMNATFFQSIGRSLSRLVDFSDSRWKHPMDYHYDEKTSREMKKEYLRKIGYPEDLVVGIISGGFEVSLETNLSDIERPASMVFKAPSENEKMAYTEAQYRGALSTVIGKASTSEGRYEMGNLLPIQFINGSVLTGHNQALARILMEAKNLNDENGRGVHIPVVVNADDLRLLELDPLPGNEGFFLTTESPAGEIIGQRYWFLEETDFPDVSPTLYDTACQVFAKLNERAKTVPVKTLSPIGGYNGIDEKEKGLPGLVFDVLWPEYHEDSLREIKVGEYLEGRLGKIITRKDEQDILGDILSGVFDNSVVAEAMSASLDVLLAGRREKLSPRQGIDLAALDKLNLNKKESAYVIQEPRKIASTVEADSVGLKKATTGAQSGGLSSNPESDGEEEEADVDNIMEGFDNEI